MQPELNRRMFLALIGAATAVTALPPRAEKEAAETPALLPIDQQPRCFFNTHHASPPAQPKSSAITYLQAL